MSIYTENGYANRKDYLDELREEYGSDMVNTLITVLPASEDFDGLVTALEDAMDSFWTVYWGVARSPNPCHTELVHHSTPWEPAHASESKCPTTLWLASTAIGMVM